MILAAMCGCRDYDGWVVAESLPVEATLTLSVSTSQSGTTRMTGDAVQANGNFRGLMDLRAIPFATQGKVTISDLAKAFDTEGLHAEEYSKSVSRFYHFETCNFMTGVSSFLVYGRALTSTGTNGQPIDKAANGSLIATVSTRANPSDISFTPDPIYNGQDAPDEGYMMANCLTDIANTQVWYMGRSYSWRAAANTDLRAFFLNFTADGQLLAASTANVQQHLNALRMHIHALNFAENTVEATLRTAILEAIDNGSELLPRNYPASAGLPAGAAVMMWNGTQFVPQTTTTTLANISSIRRYAYPAELYYYANSLIKTSNSDNRQLYYPTESSWNDILGHYEYDNSVVSNNTTAVAIKEPLQYGVACLQLGFNSDMPSTLGDADGSPVSIASEHFPLTGIIVGSQRPVGFDFTPLSDSDVDTRFIYDSNPLSGSGQRLFLGQNSPETTNTLVLQTCDGEDVTLILEFQNNSGSAFRGLNGVVYPGTRFYLIGSIEPKASPVADYEKRVFTQDYTTTITATAASLANAYNVMPDILKPHLEIGVQMVPQWTMATPASVEL